MSIKTYNSSYKKLWLLCGLENWERSQFSSPHNNQCNFWNIKHLFSIHILRTTVIAKPIFSSSHSVSSTVGTVCPRKLWMQRQLTRSKDVWREGVGIRWTFSKTDSLQVQLAARLLIYIYRRLVTTWGRPKWVQLHLVSYLVSITDRHFPYHATIWHYN